MRSGNVSNARSKQKTVTNANQITNVNGNENSRSQARDIVFYIQLIQIRLTSTIVKWQMCNMHEHKKVMVII